MSIVTLPSSIKFGPGTGLTLQTYEVVSKSDTGGAVQARVIGLPRWRLRLVAPERMNLAEAGLWEALIAELRGGVNLLEAWDPGRLLPQGSRRGVTSLASAAAVGADTLSLGGSGSLLPGDWIQVGTGVGTSQLFKVVKPSSGASVRVEPPARVAFGSGATVTVDKPLGYFRQTSRPAGWQYHANGVSSGHAVDLMEDWTP